MKSMTGYGNAEYRTADYVVSAEIKAYNNRFLDIAFTSSPLLSSFEQKVIQTIKKCVRRGHLDVVLRLKHLSRQPGAMLNEERAAVCAEVVQKVREICRLHGLEVNAGLSDILNMEGVLVSDSSVDSVSDGEMYEAAVDSCVEQALAQLEESREREGEATKQNLRQMIDGVSAGLGIIKKHAFALEQSMKEMLQTKLNEVLHDRNYDESRILTEVAVMLVRYTINEETVRLDVHVREFLRLLETGEPVGKQLDFLSQEMNREVNTIGSKSQNAQVNLEVVRMKDCIENIREQVRNIE